MVRRSQNLINIASIIMLCYAVVALVWLRLHDWAVPGILLFLINLVNIILAFFEETDKLLTALVCILVGFVSVFILKGLIFWFGLILGIYGIFLLVVLLLKRVND